MITSFNDDDNDGNLLRPILENFIPLMDLYYHHVKVYESEYLIVRFYLQILSSS